MDEKDTKYNEFPRAAVGGVVFRDDRVLLVKRAQAPARNQWAIPGGKILAGENMRDAVQREIFEETGIKVNPGEPVFVFELIEPGLNDSINFHYIIIDFDCIYVEGEAIPGDDALDVKWVSRNDLGKLSVNPKTLELLADKYNFCAI
ncbi:MAG: NUDIX hydrolase [Calditrichaceae bacterium]